VYLVIDLKVSVQGREKLARLGRPNAFGAASSAMLRRQAEAYKALAVAEAPVGGPYLSGREGGTLKRSHRVRLLNQYAAEVVADAPYARYVAEVSYPEPISYSDVMGGRRGSAVFPVKVLVSHLDRDAAEATLAGLLDEANAASVPAVLDADPSLGGAVECAQAVSTRDYGLTTISGDIAVLAVDVLIEVLA
jgi:hypothetical protein